tara:strand:+ start:251 stop:439 length:189 start_codon:yes stop_codon:yes gene_type:complete
MNQPSMYQMVFMDHQGDEQSLWKLFPDGIEAAYWGSDIARENQWTLIDVIPDDQKETALFSQ